MSESIASYWDLLDPLWDVISIDSPEEFATSGAKISRPLLLLYAAHFCYSEVCNGGFLQFFRNSTGVLAPEAIADYATLEMPETSAIVSVASATLGSVFPRQRSVRWDAMLSASGLSQAEREAIQEESGNSYQSFLHATKPLGFDALNKRFYQSSRVEGGGFEEAATRYARSLPPTSWRST